MKKIAGVLRGKFIKQLTPELYKFHAEGQVCYIVTSGKIRIEEETAIHVRISGKLGAYNKYKLIRFLPNANARRAQHTRRVKAWVETNQTEELNPALAGGKYKAVKFTSPTQRVNKKGAQKDLMAQATRELTRVLREAPENQFNIGLPAKTKRQLQQQKSNNYQINVEQERQINKRFNELTLEPRPKNSPFQRRTKEEMAEDKKIDTNAQYSKELKEFFGL